MAESKKTFSSATVKNMSDQDITTISGLPTIPSDATLNSVYLYFDAYRTNGAKNNGKVTVRFNTGTQVYETGVNKDTTYNDLSVNLTSYVNNSGGTLSYNNGATSLIFHGYQNYQYIPNVQSDWTISDIRIVANYTPHSHSYTSEVSRTPSTCKTQGSVTHKCSSCSSTQTTALALDPNNHENLVKLAAVAATCTATGLTEGQKCNACGVITVAQQTTNKIAHTQVSIPAVSPTCTNTGLTEGKKCSVCGTILVAQQTVAALGHTYETIVTDPIGSSLGYTTYRCTRCGYSYIDESSYTCRISLSCDTSMGSVAGANIYGVGSTVTITATPKEGYRFVKWSDDNTSSTRQITSTENVSYTATFEILKFSVTWKNHDGKVLHTDTDVVYGTTPSYGGTTPTKPETAKYRYHFKGWIPTISPVKSDQIYTAEFDSEVRKYTVRWMDEDRTTILEQDSTEYGTMPTYDRDYPVKPNTAAKVYTFAGWHIEVHEVEGDIDYIATYTEEDAEYTVLWHNWDGEELERDSTKYGNMPEYNGATPERLPDAQYTYTFVGWDTEIVEVTRDIIYTAVYAETINTYLVEGTTDIGGTVTGTGIYEFGDTVTLVATPLPGYTFVKWHDGDTSKTKVITVSGEVSYLAIFMAQNIYRGINTFVNPYIGISPHVAVYKGNRKIYEYIT